MADFFRANDLPIGFPDLESLSIDRTTVADAIRVSKRNADGYLIQLIGTGFAFDEKGQPIGGQVNEIVILDEDGNVFARVSDGEVELTDLIANGIADFWSTAFDVADHLVWSSGDDQKPVLDDRADGPPGKAEWGFASEADLGHDVLQFAFSNLAEDDRGRTDFEKTNTVKSAEDEIDPEIWFGALLGDNGMGDDISATDHFAIVDSDIHGDDSDNLLDGTVFSEWIFGHGGNDTIYGNGGSDVLLGGSGNDDVYGGNDTDFIHGEGGNDELFGGGGRDYIHGGEGRDTVYGGLGDDQIVGDAGDDDLFGEEGDDEFFDNPGNDTYTGGDGSDTFSFVVIGWGWQGGGGEDIILDFELGVDKLEIGNWDPNFSELSFADYVDQHAFGQADPGVVIEWENGLIRLPGVSIDDLNPWDIDLW